MVERAVVILSPQGRVAQWNQAATEIFGWSAEEASGRHVARILGTATSKAFASLQASIAQGQAWSGEIGVLRRDGRRFSVQLSSRPVVDADGAGCSVLEVTAGPIDEGQEPDHQADSRQTDGLLRRLSAIVDSSIDAIISVTTDGVVTMWNGGAERLYGYTALEAIGQSISIIVPPELRPEQRAMLAKVVGGSPVHQVETVRLRKDGAYIQIILSLWALVDDDGEVMGCGALAHDITERISTQRALELADIRFQAAFQQSAVGMVIANLQGWPTAVNPAICQILGRRPDELIGHPWMEYAPPDKVPISESVLARLRAGDYSYEAERRYLRPDGETVWLHVSVHSVRNANNEVIYFMAHMQDVTGRKLMEQELQFRALHDDLTGLPNRALLNERLEHGLREPTPFHGSIGVSFLDIDGFKHVNDALGHAVGDRLLVDVGERLVAAVRSGDTVARFGGDEFVLVCEDVTVDMMVGFAERIGEAMARPFSVRGREVALRASFGITLSRPGSTSQSLLSEADAAMYRAKELGRGRTVIFDDSLRARAETVVEGERALATAIEAGEIVAFYQPIVDFSTGAPVGVEALARWLTPNGQILPRDFIPLAESTGLIDGLGERILTQAVADVACWNAGAGDRAPIWVSVNLSARQLSDSHLVDLVGDILQTHELRPELLHLEVTETVAMENVAHSIVVLKQLKALGAKLSIDDFGTGYSSLSYLQQLPFDMLKVDGSFVHSLGYGPGGASILKAVLSLGEALGMTCVAEGVETAEQFATLTNLGCPLGQGYLWSGPLCSADVEAYLIRSDTSQTRVLARASAKTAS